MNDGPLFQLRRALSGKRFARILVSSILGEIGVVVTILSGLLLVTESGFCCLFGYAYGLPLKWRFNMYVEVGYLPTSFNWVLFAADVLFYMATGYLIIIAYRRIVASSGMNPPPPFFVAAAYVIALMILFAWNTLFVSRLGIL